MKPAFSTVACPGWTLETVLGAAARWGYEALEFRTFGHGSTASACDPALTDPAKVCRLVAEAGVEPCCLATSIRYDAPVRPPVIGRLLGDFDRPVRQSKSAIQMAAAIECPLVRVFGFEVSGREQRERAMSRILERLTLALACARNTGVKLVIENGGSFPTAADLAEFIDRAESPLLGAAYSVAVGAAAGDDPRSAVNVLADRLWSVKLRDFKDGRPVPLGQGDVPNRLAVEALAASGYAGPLIVEFDGVWLRETGAETDPTEALAHGADTIYDWAGITREGTSARHAHAVV